MTDFENYLHSKGYRLNTVKTILGDIRRFTEWSQGEGIQAEKANYNDLFAYIQSLHDKINGKRTINQKITNLKHYYFYQVEQGVRRDNPALEFRIRNTVKTVPHHLLTRSELETIYNNYPSNKITGKRNKTFIGLLIYQGITTGELAALETSDIKLEEGKIYIPAVGRRNSRTLDLEAHQIIRLQNYILTIRPALLSSTGKKSDKLFISSGTGIKLTNSFVRILAAMRKINPKVKDLKQIRASVITAWLKQYNIRKVQYLCGHRYVSSTEYYRTDKMESLQEQLEKLHPIK